MFWEVVPICSPDTCMYVPRLNMDNKDITSHKKKNQYKMLCRFVGGGSCFGIFIIKLLMTS